jgi:hypothetical protein
MYGANIIMEYAIAVYVGWFIYHMVDETILKSKESNITIEYNIKEDK